MLYSALEPNQPERDWLYDIRLYAEIFYADSSSMILNEIGMCMEFRPVATLHRAFFTNKTRLNHLKKLLPHNANKEDIGDKAVTPLLPVQRLF